MTRKKAKAAAPVPVTTNTTKYEIIDVDGDRRDFEDSDGCTAYDFDTYEAALKAVHEYETTETAFLPWTIVRVDESKTVTVMRKLTVAWKTAN